MTELTENSIKRAALSFLKAHYRYRPRADRSTVQLNMRGEGGILVDGYLSFPREDDTPFVATVEATSYQTREEVRYRVQPNLLFWDATAAGAFVTAILFTVGHIQNHYFVPAMGGWLQWTALALFVIFVLHIVYRFFFSRLRRYRYIYAIEQFKRYHADEQWVAIGEDVFPDKKDRFFRELREQCIYNGFGLLIIDRELRPHLSITPSRVDLFRRQRKKVELFSLEEFTKKLQQSLHDQRWDSVVDRLPWKQRKAAGTMLLRFRPSFFKQMIISGTCLVLIFTLFYLQYQQLPVQYVDEETYESQMLSDRAISPAEPRGYLVDTPGLRPYRHDVEPYLPREEKPIPPRPQPGKRRPGLIVYQAGEGFFDYDCERLYSGNEVRFAIAVEIFDSENPLRQLIRRFNENGLDAMGLWLGCFSADEDDFVLFLQQLYATRRDAEDDLPVWQERIEKRGFSAKLEILPLRKSD